MTQLYRFELLSDVFVDVCLRDASGKLLFMSCYGRDTSIQQMFASFTLPRSEGGLDTFHLRGADDIGHLVEIGNADRLEKLTGRLPHDNLFGNLVHAWVFDPCLQRADYANRIAWLMNRQSALVGDQLELRIWEIYKQLSPVPLLDHWQAPLLDATRSVFITAFNEESLYEPLGDIAAYRIQLDESFLEIVSAMVKSYVLTLSECQTEKLAA